LAFAYQTPKKNGLPLFTDGFVFLPFYPYMAKNLLFSGKKKRASLQVPDLSPLII